MEWNRCQETDGGQRWMRQSSHANEPLPEFRHVADALVLGRPHHEVTEPATELLRAPSRSLDVGDANSSVAFRKCLEVPPCPRFSLQSSANVRGELQRL